MPRKVSVIIRCFNEEKHIARLLAGIQEQTIKDVEVVLVDSGSTDATISIASKYPIKLIRIKPETFSFGYSINQGCENASGEFLVFASAHVYPVYEDWLENLLLPFEDDRVALCYGKQRGNDATRYSEHQVFAKWFPDNSCFDESNPFCNNANSAIRRKTWESHPFDESLTGLEDLDWARRQIKLGKGIAYAADAEIIHVHEETPIQIYNRYKREAVALKCILPEGHFSLWDFIRLVGSNLASDYYHALHDKVLLSNLIDIPVFRMLQFWGTYMGFRQSGQISQHMKHAFYYPRGMSRVENGVKPQDNRINYASGHNSDE